jgi:dihydroorotate dehydrogenase
LSRLYRLARPFLFSLDPEAAHRLGLRLAALAVPRKYAHPVRAMGIDFANPVGLAAGLDKDAAHIDHLARLGFGFLEVGTVTPRPQPGNPKPRLFRLPAAGALINRFGFNNVGVDAFLENVARARWKGALGVNIGKNADTPPERAIDDYELGLRKVQSAASYVTINISSPNTKGLRTLQEREALEKLLDRLAAHKRVPLVLKVAPDLDEAAIDDIAAAVDKFRLDGLIATNTSLSRTGVENVPHAREAGGLSGRPIRAQATWVLRQFRARLPGITLIGAGGIMAGADAAEKFSAGASLVQLYTGLVYRGPELVGECVSAYRAK